MVSLILKGSLITLLGDSRHMNLESIIELIDSTEKEELATMLKLLIEPHSSPVFGAAKVIEHEIAMIKVLKKLGYLPETSDEYFLVEKLRVTKPKARSLLYQEALREKDDNVNDELRKVLINPRIKKDNNGFFLIEVPYPLTMDRLRSKVRTMGYLTDGSFSGSIAKIPMNAMIQLVVELMPSTVQAELIDKLHENGLPDTSLKGFVVATFRKVGQHIADDTGEEIAETVGETVKQLFNGWFSSELADEILE